MANLEKGKIYKETIRRYNSAYKNGFYFECILLVYSMLEDRLSDFFVKIEFATNNNRTFKFEKSRKAYLDEIMEEKCFLGNLCGKAKAVKTIVEKSSESNQFKSLYI